jgi:hypothetical protein
MACRLSAALSLVVLETQLAKEQVNFRWRYFKRFRRLALL